MCPRDCIISVASGAIVATIDDNFRLCVWTEMLFPRYLIYNQPNRDTNITRIQNGTELCHESFFKQLNSNGVPEKTKSADDFMQDIRSTVHGDDPIQACFLYRKSFWHKEGECVLSF